MGYGDWRAYSAFHETRCAIFDSELLARQSSGRSRTLSYSPLFAVRYDTTAREEFSTGYGGPSNLNSGSPWFASRILDSLTIGSSHPCWYDPEDAKTVLLDRSPGGGYLFALLPLSLLMIGGYFMRRSRRPA